MKRVAQDLKKHLADFLRGDKRPDLRLMHDGMLHNATTKPVGETLHVIPRHFASQLQRFVKSPATDNRPVSMSSILLLCKHGQMMYNLEAQTIIDSSVDLVWQQEYEALEKNVEADARVTVRFVNEILIDGGAAEDAVAAASTSTAVAAAASSAATAAGGLAQPRLVYDPPLCFECAQQKLEEKKRQMFEFEGEKIFVRKLGDRDAECKLDEDDDAFKISSAGGAGGGGSGGAGGSGVANGFASYENDPEFQPELYAEPGSSSSSSSKKRVSDAKISAGAGDGCPDSKKFRSASPAALAASTRNGGNDDDAGRSSTAAAVAAKMTNGAHHDALNGEVTADSADLSQVSFDNERDQAVGVRCKNK